MTDSSQNTKGNIIFILEIKFIPSGMQVARTRLWWAPHYTLKTQENAGWRSDLSWKFPPHQVECKYCIYYLQIPTNNSPPFQQLWRFEDMLVIKAKKSSDHPSSTALQPFYISFLTSSIPFFFLMRRLMTFSFKTSQSRVWKDLPVPPCA